MKLSKKVENKRIGRHICLFIAVLLLTATFLSLAGAKVALAEDSDRATDTFAVLFPRDSLNYVQSKNPTIIASNETYLIIYDKTASTMFVRGGDRIGTYAFPLDIDGVEYIKAVGNTAFVHAQGENYTVDLKNTDSRPVKVNLTSPVEANYFRSDGTYLYAKNLYGAITVYDENLEVAEFSVDNGGTTETVKVDNYTYRDGKNEPVFAGKTVLAGNDQLLYFFTTDRNEPVFIVFDPVSKQEIVTPQPMQNYVTEAYVGDNIIVGQISSVSSGFEVPRLVGIDKSTGKTIFSTDIVPDSFCVFGNRLYTIEGKQIMTYMVEKNAKGEYTGFRKLSTISMAGNDPYHLDEPSDVATVGTNVVVADTNNNRIGIINSASVMTTVTLKSSPLKLATDGLGIFALCADQNIVKIENNLTVQTLSAEGAKDIAYLDKLYFITDGGLYTLLGGEKLKLTDVEGARRLTCAKDGTNLYVLKDDGVHVYTTDGTLVCTLGDNFANVKDIAVDYAGTVFALREDGFDEYANLNGVISKSSSTQFVNATARVSANSLAIESGYLYFSTAECLIGKSRAVSYTKDTYVSSTYEPTVVNSYHFAKLKSGVSSYAIPADGRSEGVFPAPAQTLLVLDGDSAEDGFAYALLNGKFLKIRKDDYGTVGTTALTGDYATKRNTYLYTLPGVEKDRISALAGTRFTLIGDCADFENSKWLRVNYYDKIYFIPAEDCGEYTEVIPEEDRLFGRAKASRVGGVVGIYAEASDGANKLLEIVDGTRVEVLDKLDAYYLVRYENTVGYMRKTDVQIDGLTTVQIVSIAVACVVAVAGIGIFIAIEVTKKKSEEAERRAEKKQK